MTYAKHVWNPGESGGTPITAAKLNEIEQQLEDNDLSNPTSPASSGLSATYVAATSKGTASGIASLDASTKLPAAQLPATAATTDTAQTVAGTKTFSARQLFKAGPIFDVRAFGAVGDGTTSDQAAFTSAIAAAVAVGGGTVYVPAGTYAIASFVALKDKVNIRGDGMDRSILKAKTGLATGVLVGTSGDTASDFTISDLTVDGSYTDLSLTVNGVQITAGARVIFDHVKVNNVGGVGILLQTDSTDNTVQNCILTGTGLSGNTGNHSIVVTTRSHRCKLRANRITGGKAMGINIGAAGNGSTDCEISGNYIEVVPTATGLECIGVTADNLRTIVSNNHCVNSQDNGISVTAADCVVTGNVVEGALNHGIAVGGNNCAVTGNRVRNPGQLFTTDGLAYGGITIDTASNCTVVGNAIYDDQSTPTMGYGVKENNTANNNIIIGNRMRGFRLSEFLRTGAATMAILGTRPTVTGAKGSNAALGSLITALATAGLINDTTTA